MTDYRHLLLAVDFSKETSLLLQRAADMAQRYGALLSLVHVVEPVIIDPSYDVFPAVPLDIEQDLVEQASTQLCAVGGEYRIGAENCHVVVGATKSEILRLAESHGVDLIIVGSHGRHGVALLLGSTANAVLHGASCDVLAVRIK